MGELIQSFTFGRNTLKRTVSESALAAIASVRRAEKGIDLQAMKRDDNGAYNIIRDLISFSGVLAREEDRCRVTPLGDSFRELHALGGEDAWRWLITRSLWLYVVPNGTKAEVNAVANRLGVSFSFFRTILGLLCHMYALPGNGRVLYYDELCEAFDDDSAWSRDPSKLFSDLMMRRQDRAGESTARRSLLGDLEDAYNIPRDNLNTVLNKAFQQTGLFDYTQEGARIVGISISSNLDSVMQRRVRFVLDNPISWGSGDWSDFLQLRTTDLPLEVTRQPTLPIEGHSPENLGELLPKAVNDFAVAGIITEVTLLQRFAASLLAKKFMILTGLSGSGKTKLAQAFARWITPFDTLSDPFVPGAKIASDRIDYYVTSADSLAVEFRNHEESAEAKRVTLPRAMIQEWAEFIQLNKISKDLPAKEVRRLVAEKSQFSSQLHSFETHLKAAAYALLEARKNPVAMECFAVVPVGADWTSNEHILGYPDNLNGGYFQQTALKLILQAEKHPAIPHFLILDEMNLSHVERYFADLLSLIESNDKIWLHHDAEEKRGVQAQLSLPENLFVVGTVNVDETTYMFSPKVLDRANVLEFRVSESDMAQFLDNPEPPDLDRLAEPGMSGAAYGESFVVAASRRYGAKLPGDQQKRLKAELMLFFGALGEHNGEFGFRVGKEISRFLHFYTLLSGGTLDFRAAMDAQIVQKLLPKLHGSRNKMTGLLWTFAALCAENYTWKAEADDAKRTASIDKFLRDVRAAVEAGDENFDPANIAKKLNAAKKEAHYPLSFDKIIRMWRILEANGFVSFAEA